MLRGLIAMLAATVAVGAVFIALVATRSLPFINGAPAAPPAIAGDHVRVGRFDGPAAWRLLKLQVAYGPRPAGSPRLAQLAERLRRLLPHGRYEPVSPGLRNIVATVRGRDPRRWVVVGAHYDSKDIPGFVGANDGASGTAAVVELARQLRPRSIRPSVAFILFDGEETPRGVPESDFLRYGVRGSTVAARDFRYARAMVLLDFIANRRLAIPREAFSDEGLWAKLRAAARAAGVGRHFPPGTEEGIFDDHTPFQRQGVRSIDLIDWDFPCFHRVCDNLHAVSEASLDASGEAVWHLLPTL